MKNELENKAGGREQKIKVQSIFYKLLQAHWTHHQKTKMVPLECDYTRSSLITHCSLSSVSWGCSSIPGSMAPPQHWASILLSPSLLPSCRPPLSSLAYLNSSLQFSLQSNLRKFINGIAQYFLKFGGLRHGQLEGGILSSLSLLWPNFYFKNDVIRTYWIDKSTKSGGLASFRSSNTSRHWVFKRQ